MQSEKSCGSWNTTPVWWKYASRLIDNELGQPRETCKAPQKDVRHAHAGEEVEFLKSLELSDGSQVRHARAVAEVEVLKSLESGQRRKVCQLRGLTISEPFELPSLVDPDLAQEQHPELRQIPQTGRELAQRQIAEVQDLGPIPPGLFDPALRLPHLLLHDG
jgi:hypothetical protein